MIQELFKPENFIFLGRGLLVTLQIAVFSILFSTVIGTLLGVARYSNHPVLGRLAAVYIEAVRNVPMLLFILGVRFLTPLRAVIAGVAAITIFTSAVIAEIIRGGLNSIHKEQWEAARSQGFTYRLTLQHIILPQAYRNMIPPMVSQFVTVVKDTCFVWAVGIEELFGKGMIIMGKYSSSTQVFMMYTLLALIYFALNYPLSIFARNRQRKMIHQGM